MSKDLLYELIEALTILPGVGKKSAQRMALFLLDKNKDGALHLAKTLEECLDAIQRCEVCRQLTSEPVCRICSDQSRDAYSLCVVESPSDVLKLFHVYGSALRTRYGAVDVPPTSMASTVQYESWSRTIEFFTKVPGPSSRKSLRNSSSTFRGPS